VAEAITGSHSYSSGVTSDGLGESLNCWRRRRPDSIALLLVSLVFGRVSLSFATIMLHGDRRRRHVLLSIVTHCVYIIHLVKEKHLYNAKKIK
jgi:hypothetical protein